MHGLVNRAIQRFVSDGYGQAKWDATAQLAGLETSEIEPMLTYEDGLTPRLLMAASEVLGRQYEELLEDIGTYIVSHPNVDGGHPSDISFLTAAPHPATSSFRNSISLDQHIAEHLGGHTRFPSLTLAVNGARSLSWKISKFLGLR